MDIPITQLAIDCDQNATQSKFDYRKKNQTLGTTLLMTKQQLTRSHSKEHAYSSYVHNPHPSPTFACSWAPRHMMDPKVVQTVGLLANLPCAQTVCCTRYGQWPPKRHFENLFLVHFSPLI